MSFDLGIWDKQIGTTADVYLKLCEGEFTPEGTSQALLDSTWNSPGDGLRWTPFQKNG